MLLKLDNLTAVGLVITLCFAALAYGAVEPWSIAAVIAALAALLILWALKTLFEKQTVVLLPASFWPLTGLWLLALLQSFRRSGLSQDVEASRIAVIIGGAMLCFLFLCLNLINSRARVKGLVKFLSFYGFGMAIFALLQHFTWNGKFYWLRKPLNDLSTPYGPFANHNHFAGYMEMLTVLPVALVAAGAIRREQRPLYSFMASFMGVTIFFSLSRGGILSLVCSLLFIGVVAGISPLAGREGKAGLWRPIVAVLGIAAIITLAMLWIGADPVIGRFSESSDTLSTSRLWIWEDSLRVFRDHPFLGSGFGSLQTVYPHRAQYDGALGYVAQSHNDYIQILAEGGIISGILVLWFLGLVLRDVFRGIRMRDPVIAGLSLGAGAGIVAILVHSTVDFNLQLPSNIMLFLLLTAIASFCGRASSTSGAEVDYPVRNPNAPHIRDGVLK